MVNRHAVIHALYMAQKKIPFQWGVSDCLHFCGDAALALTGTDPIAEIRGRYASDTEAKRLMVENGCGSLAEVAVKAFEPIPVAMAQSGDWALIMQDDGSEVLGVVCADKVVARTPTGIGRAYLTQAMAAFRVV